jgi:hypothetical protein
MADAVDAAMDATHSIPAEVQPNRLFNQLAHHNAGWYDQHKEHVRLHGPNPLWSHDFVFDTSTMVITQYVPGGANMFTKAQRKHAAEVRFRAAPRRQPWRVARRAATRLREHTLPTGYAWRPARAPCASAATRC